MNPDETLNTHSKTPLENAVWIWDSSPPSALNSGPLDHYRCFRRRFHLEDISADGDEPYLDLSADSDFVAWINGVEVARGQFSDWPTRKTWTRFTIPSAALRRGSATGGDNVLCVLVFYCAADSASHAAGEPGLLAALAVDRQLLITCADGQWRTSAHAAFHSGRSERMTLQTGFTFDYDARQEETWLTPEFPDHNGDWQAAHEANHTQRILLPRPLPSLVLGDVGAVQVTAQGLFFDIASAPGSSPDSNSPADHMAERSLRSERPWRVFANRPLRPMFATLDPEANPADAAPADAEYTGAPVDPGTFLNHTPIRSVDTAPSDNPLILSDISHAHTKAAGRYLIIDLGIETVGFIELEIAAAAGTVIEIAHGEHLDDGRVRMKIGTRRFADRYTCGNGTRCFQMPFRRIGARFLEIHVHGTSEVRLHRLGLRTISYPTNPLTTGTFLTDDPLARRAWSTAVRTLDRCRHHYFEDSPWREQALYAYDSRLQALYGYHAFGDYDIAETSFSLLAHGYDAARGLLPLNAPGKCPINIPSFSLSWIGAIADHWLYSGNDQLYSKYSDIVNDILDHACSSRHESSGLYFPPAATDIWNFYEWAPGLCGAMGNVQENGPRELHAVYLLHLHNALRSAAWMAARSNHSVKASAWAEQAARLADSFKIIFWNPLTFCWASTVTISASDTFTRLGVHEFVQALACAELSLQIVSPTQNVPSSTPCTINSLFMLARALLPISPEARRQICERVENAWETLLFAGATTFWETAAGARDFDYAGSLCHGWNALPAWFYQAVILGVQPLAPGFREFSVKIYPYRFASAKGRIPTPAGFITVEWSRRDAGLHLELHCPVSCIPKVGSFKEAPLASVVCNGQPIQWV